MNTASEDRLTATTKQLVDVLAEARLSLTDGVTLLASMCRTAGAHCSAATRLTIARMLYLAAVDLDAQVAQGEPQYCGRWHVVEREDQQPIPLAGAEAALRARIQAVQPREQWYDRLIDNKLVEYKGAMGAIANRRATPAPERSRLLTAVMNQGDFVIAAARVLVQHWRDQGGFNTAILDGLRQHVEQLERLLMPKVQP